MQPQNFVQRPVFQKKNAQKASLDPAWRETERDRRERQRIDRERQERETEDRQREGE